MHPHKNRLLALVATTALILSACGGGGEAVRQRREKEERRTAKSFDPPKRFDIDDGISLPNETTSSTLHANKAFVVLSSTVLVIDTITGKPISTIKTKEQPSTTAGNPASAPVVAGIEGATVVLVPVRVTIPGSGTKSQRDGVEILAISANTGKKLWSLPFELDEAEAPTSNPLSVGILGVSNDVVVVRAEGFTYGVDVATKEVAWRRAGFEAAALSRGIAIGISHDAEYKQVVLALNAADGVDRWADTRISSDLNVQPGGHAFVLVAGDDYDDGKSYFRLIESTTGRVIEAPPTERLIDTNITCRYDESATTACSADDWSAAFDASTGEWLWELPDHENNRVVIEVTAAFHGAIYGTTENGPVVLDARSGEDREASPGIAPSVVNRFGGIGMHPTEQELYVFPAAA